jgi:4-oxalocrotonate tautomerase family enzyme
MPIVRVDILNGKNDEYKKLLLDTVNQAMIKWMGVAPGDRRQILTEHNPANFEHGGRSESYTVIEITLIKGRNFETKKKFYRDLVDSLSQKLGIPPSDITIILNEQPAENWGIRGGFPASEVL